MKIVCLLYHSTYIWILTDEFYVVHDLTVVTLKYGTRRWYEEAEGNETYVGGSIVVGKYALPNFEGLVHLKLLGEEESYPSEAVNKGIYLQLI